MKDDNFRRKRQCFQLQICTLSSKTYFSERGILNFNFTKIYSRNFKILLPKSVIFLISETSPTLFVCSCRFCQYFVGITPRRLNSQTAPARSRISIFPRISNLLSLLPSFLPSFPLSLTAHRQGEICCSAPKLTPSISIFRSSSFSLRA